MAGTTKLKQFRFEPSENAMSAQIHIEDERGGTLELTASREQLELLADTLDDFLADTEDADEVEGDELDDGDEDDLDDEDPDEGEGADDAAPTRDRR